MTLQTGALWRRGKEPHRAQLGGFPDDQSELWRGSGASALRSEIEHRVDVTRGRLSAAIDHGRELSAQARDQVRRGIDTSRDVVVERPLSSITVAAIGGLLIGMLLSRRS